MQGGPFGGGLSWVRRHPKLTALVLYALLSVLFFSPGLRPGHTTSGADYLWSAAPWNAVRPSGVPQATTHPPTWGTDPELVDPATVFNPFLQYTRSQLPTIPLWNPYIMGGAPYLADMQSAVFSPFSVPAYVLPFGLALTVIAILKLLVAAMGMFLLARALRMTFAAAFVAGTVYGFGLFMVAWVPWPLANVFPFIPWLLLATELLIRRPGPLPAAGLALVVALQFLGGHPESSFHALVATVAWFVLRMLQRGGGGIVTALQGAAGRGRSRLSALWSTARRPTVGFLLALALGTALAAIVILPFLEFLHNSSDLTARPRSGVYVQPRYFLAALLPGYFPNGFEVETAFYAGALPLLLVVVALLRPRVERVAVAVFAALCLLVVLGIQPFFWLVGHAPGFDVTYNSRLTILYLLAVALLAGWGLDDLVRRRPGRHVTWAVATAAAALLVVPVVVLAVGHGSSTRFLGSATAAALGFVNYPNPTKPHALAVIRLAGLVVWLIVATAAGALLLARVRWRLAASVFAILAVGLVVGDLFQAGMGENPAIPTSHAVQPTTPAIRYLQGQRPARFAAVNPTVGVVPFPPDMNMRYGLYDARGYDYPVDTRFARMWTRYVAPPTPLLSLDTPAVPILFPTSLRILSLLGARDILQPPGQPPLQLQGLHPVYQGRDATIYANDNALPRAWLVAGQQLVAGDSAALAQIVSPSFDPRREVLTNRRLPGLPQGPGVPSPGGASLVHYGATRATIDVEARTTAELVLSDTSYPGWKVTLDGRPVRLDRVDYLFRGVPVPAGAHRVEFTYAPASYRAGWMLSLAAAIVLVAAVLVGVRRRRIADGAQTPPGSFGLGRRRGRRARNAPSSEELAAAEHET